MYKYIDNYVNTNHVTQFPYPVDPPPPLPLYSSDLVGAFICKAQNYSRKCYIYTVWLRTEAITMESSRYQSLLR